ncbi:uncharacterized protein E5676_scaffold352G005330 [Cucumis melo var. makuwa]|uniref:Uncharacterized protein LOC103486755 n=2 Tax=Cucumis melo TaxID=3656 RepID=A0A1S3B7W5_CUCME|nr:uncharacterized protein LOC103486755 [Cucumis melo]KAA0043741.1 uncharacterized protein E6C27_scaffold236G00700 [Cucumis melo var. makuwa]TYK25391.1 uncharacterized protein E5676_scaffold352G005330 [Cucumis melo var. makuwa]
MDEYKHFSHLHDLELYQIQEDQTNQQFRCSGCESLCTHGLVYGCQSCEFFLHEACATAPRSLQHPSHPSHHLTLLPSPTYPDGSFLCNACGATGTAFCFSCIPCDIDLHVDCGLLPQQLDLESHRHTLSLLFSPPSSICNLCRRAIDSRYWSYSCSTCNFDIHTYCATTPTAPPVGGLRNDRHVQFPAVGEGDYDSVSPVDRYGGVTTVNTRVGVVEDPFLKAQAELHELQMQMQIVNEMAKMMASVNLSSLAP